MRKHSRTRKILAAVLVLAWMLPNAGLRAQEKKQEADPQKQAGEAAKQGSPVEHTVRKLIRVKHIDIDELVPLFAGLGRMTYSPDLKLIMFVGPESVAAELEATVREFDVPQGPGQAHHRTGENDVQIIFHLLGVTDEVPSEPIPDLLKDVVRELKGTFPYKNYQLLETAVVRTRVAAIAEVHGIFPGGSRPGTGPDSYKLKIHVEGVSGAEGSRIIQLEQLSFVADLSVESFPASENRLPQYQHRSLTIQANVSVPEGKTVVVGKAGTAGATRGIFLVLTAKVVD